MNIEQEIEALKARNERVEGDKAWETSKTRMGAVSLITYIGAAFLLQLIGAENIFLGALVPVAGFLLSTLTLPPLKQYWTSKREE